MGQVREPFFGGQDNFRTHSLGNVYEGADLSGLTEAVESFCDDEVMKRTCKVNPLKEITRMTREAETACAGFQWEVVGRDMPAVIRTGIGPAKAVRTIWRALDPTGATTFARMECWRSSSRSEKNDSEPCIEKNDSEPCIEKNDSEPEFEPDADGAFVALEVTGKLCLVAGCINSHPFVETHRWCFVNSDGSTWDVIKEKHCAIAETCLALLLQRASDYVLEQEH